MSVTIKTQMLSSSIEWESILSLSSDPEESSSPDTTDTSDTAGPVQALPMRRRQQRNNGDLFVNERGQHRLWRNEKLFTLCNECAKRGVVRHANYSNRKGDHATLCSVHASLHGTHVSRRRCRMCAKPDAPLATHPDFNGSINKLCVHHAIEWGTVQAPRCRLCPPHERAAAEVFDAEGSGLCGTHHRLAMLVAFVDSC